MLAITCQNKIIIKQQTNKQTNNHDLKCPLLHAACLTGLCVWIPYCLKDAARPWPVGQVEVAYGRSTAVPNGTPLNKTDQQPVGVSASWNHDSLFRVTRRREEGVLNIIVSQAWRDRLGLRRHHGWNEPSLLLFHGRRVARCCCQGNIFFLLYIFYILFVVVVVCLFRFVCALV